MKECETVGILDNKYFFKFDSETVVIKSFIKVLFPEFDIPKI